MTTDFIVHGMPQDTVFLLEPVTIYAADWIEEHIPTNAPTVGNNIAVEHRFIGQIVRGIQDDGLTVKHARLQ